MWQKVLCWIATLLSRLSWRSMEIELDLAESNRLYYCWLCGYWKPRLEMGEVACKECEGVGEEA